MKKPYSIAEGVGHAITKKLIAIVVAAVFSVIALGLFHLADKTKFEAFRVVGIIVFLLGLFIAVFASKEVYARMTEDDSLTFSLAVAHTWYHYLLYLSFVPLIGPAIGCYVEWRKKRNPFLSDEDQTADPEHHSATRFARG